MNTSIGTARQDGPNFKYMGLERVKQYMCGKSHMDPMFCVDCQKYKTGICEVGERAVALLEKATSPTPVENGLKVYHDRLRESAKAKYLDAITHEKPAHYLVESGQAASLAAAYTFLYTARKQYGEKGTKSPAEKKETAPAVKVPENNTSMEDVTDLAKFLKEEAAKKPATVAKAEKKAENAEKTPKESSVVTELRKKRDELLKEKERIEGDLKAVERAIKIFGA